MQRADVDSERITRSLKTPEPFFRLSVLSSPTHAAVPVQRHSRHLMKVCRRLFRTWVPTATQACRLAQWRAPVSPLVVAGSNPAPLAGFASAPNFNSPGGRTFVKSVRAALSRRADSLLKLPCSSVTRRGPLRAWTSHDRIEKSGKDPHTIDTGSCLFLPGTSRLLPDSAFSL